MNRIILKTDLLSKIRKKLEDAYESGDIQTAIETGHQIDEELIDNIINTSEKKETA